MPVVHHSAVANWSCTCRGSRLNGFNTAARHQHNSLVITFNAHCCSLAGNTGASCPTMVAAAFTVNSNCLKGLVRMGELPPPPARAFRPAAEEGATAAPATPGWHPAPPLLLPASLAPQKFSRLHHGFSCKTLSSLTALPSSFTSTSEGTSTVRLSRRRLLESAAAIEKSRNRFEGSVCAP